MKEVVMMTADSGEQDRDGGGVCHQPIIRQPGCLQAPRHQSRSKQPISGNVIAKAREQSCSIG